jgi:hypothetical protein
MVNMKTALTVMLVAAFAGCIIFGIALTSTFRETNELKTRVATQQDEMNSVQAELNSVQANLNSVQTELDRKNAEVAQVQTDISNTETDLNAVTDELTSTETQLAQAKRDLVDANHQLDNAAALNTQMADSYTTLRNEIDQKTGSGADCESFVTPDDPDVAAQAQDIAGSFAENANERWGDFRRMYDWVVDNIDYNYDTSIPLLPSSLDSYEEIEWFAEYWKMPAETLADGNGDCEDMANLLASLILSYNNQLNAVWLVEIEGYDSGHVAVVLPVTGDKLAILDPAGHYYTGTGNDYLQSADISTEVYNWLDYWSDDIPGAEVTTIYSNDFNEEFSSTQEFIDWAIARYAD